MQLRHGGRALADVWARIDRQALLEDEHRFSAHDYGLRLYDAVLTGAVGRAYQRLIGRAGPDEALRVQLEIHPDAPELQALPWERLFHVFGDAEVALAADAHTPFSRFLTSGAGDVPPVEAPVLRLLVAIANPEGLPAGCAPLDVAGEAERLAGVLARLGGRTRSHSESKKPKRFLHSQHAPWHAAKHENAGRPGPGIADRLLGISCIEDNGPSRRSAIPAAWRPQEARLKPLLRTRGIREERAPFSGQNPGEERKDGYLLCQRHRRR